MLEQKNMEVLIMDENDGYEELLHEEYDYRLKTDPAFKARERHSRKLYKQYEHELRQRRKGAVKE